MPWPLIGRKTIDKRECRGFDPNAERMAQNKALQKRSGLVDDRVAVAGLRTTKSRFERAAWV